MNVNFPTRLVFAAAVEADRINGGYYKFPTSEDNIEKKKNFDIIKHLLEEKTTFKHSLILLDIITSNLNLGSL